MKQKERGSTPRFLHAFVFFAFGFLVCAVILLSFQPNPLKSMRGTHELNDALRIIKNDYYKYSNTEELYLAAIHGMVDSLEDPYAAFYTGEEYAQLQQTQKGSYEGIGIALGQNQADSSYFIAHVYEDSPADKAGLKVKDQIVEIDGETLLGKTSDEVVTMIRGSKEVRLKLRRNASEWTVTISVSQVPIKRVKFRMIAEIAYTRISDFHGDCVAEYKEALEQAKSAGAKGLILDLRNNPGGGLTEVKGIADFFLDEGVLMSMRTRNGVETFEYTTDNAETNLPMVVLINGQSASASELLAGALQDRQRARIIGTKSFGKGIVQSIMPLFGDDSYLKLTTATYYTPNGRSIHGEGIEPDIEVVLNESNETLPLDDIAQGQDAPLESAIAYLNKEIAAK